MIYKIFSRLKNKKKINLKKIAKKNLLKEDWKKIKKIKDKQEKQEALKYLLTSKLYLRYYNLQDKLEKLDEKEKTFIDLKLKSVPFKIKLFQAGFEKDLLNTIDLINEIEKLVKNV